MSTVQVNVSFGQNGVASVSTYSNAPVSISVTTGGTAQPTMAPYIPPVNQQPLNTGATSQGSTQSSISDNTLLTAILQIVQALDPQAAPMIQQVEQQLGINSGTNQVNTSTGSYNFNSGTNQVNASTGSYNFNSGTNQVNASTGSYNFNSGTSSNITTGGSSFTYGSSVSTGTYTSTNAGNYGSSDLAANKAAVLAQCKAQGLSQEQTDTILTIGSIETNDMSPSERDASKDGTASENYSAFNLNKGMLQAMGYNPDSGPNLNDPANIGLVVHLMSQAMNTFGTDGFLAWQRGGSTGYQDGSSYGVKDYIAAVNQGNSEVQSNQSLLTSDQRIPTPNLAHE